MKKYVKRPIVVEAEQWFPGKQVEGVQCETYEDFQSLGPCHEYYVVTAHRQRVILKPGDWVIKEPDNRGYYPCKPDIFADTYEACE